MILPLESSVDLGLNCDADNWFGGLNIFLESSSLRLSSASLLLLFMTTRKFCCAWFLNILFLISYYFTLRRSANRSTSTSLLIAMVIVVILHFLTILSWPVYMSSPYPVRLLLRKYLSSFRVNSLRASQTPFWYFYADRWTYNSVSFHRQPSRTQFSWLFLLTFFQKTPTMRHEKRWLPRHF